MEFVLDDDQRELQATVRGIVDKECTIAFVRSVIDDGVDPGPWWRTMTELYWPALAIPEADVIGFYVGLGFRMAEVPTVGGRVTFWRDYEGLSEEFK